MPRSSKTKKRTFVLDTNVLIHDPNAIFNFDEHDVVIPITVVEELDHLKSGNESRNVSARQASRNLTRLIKEGGEESPTSIPLGEKKGNLIFFVFEKYPEVSAGAKNSFRNIFLEDCADHRIIAIAYMLKENGADVTIVTKDNNVLIKATALGINAEDYTHDMVKNPDQLTEKIKEIDPEDLDLPKNTADLELYLNQPVMVKGCSDGQDHIYRWQGKDFDLIKREEIGKTKVKPKNLEQDFAVDILMDPEGPHTANVMTDERFNQFRRNHSGFAVESFLVFPVIDAGQPVRQNQNRRVILQKGQCFGNHGRFAADGFSRFRNGCAAVLRDDDSVREAEGFKIRFCFIKCHSSQLPIP